MQPLKPASSSKPTWPFLLSVALWALSAARADVRFNVSFADPGGTFTAYQPAIRSHVQAAGADWARYLKTPAGVTPSIEVQIAFGNNSTANGGSETSVFVAARGGFNVFEQGMAAEIRTGTDPNGPAADVVITIGRDYLRNELWFDPEPTERRATVPANRTDAYSTLLHELGHALVFNGWRDFVTGALPLPAGAEGAYRSPWDEDIVVEPGGKFFFTGSAATARYGTRLPLTSANIHHLGNGGSGLGGDLVSDLMNGVVTYRGYRYFISTIDLAILQDTGVALARTEIVPPELRSLEPAAGGQLTARWTGANHRLRLEHTASLTSPDWQPFATGLDGTEHTFTPPAGETGFFRLIAE